MSFGNLFRPPRHLFVLFLALTLAPTSALVWMGWRLLNQERTLEQQRMAERRAGAVALAVTAIQQSLAAIEQRLGDPSEWSTLATDGGRVVVISASAVDTVPEERLLYYPFPPVLPVASQDLFREIDDAEVPFDNPDTSIAKLREMARSASPAIRAGADLRLARTLRKLGQLPAALEAYDDLARQKDVAAAGLPGIPAELVARGKRCELLAQLNRTEDLRREAQALDADLRVGRWRLEQAVYLKYAEDAQSWLGEDRVFTGAAVDDSQQQALAAAVNLLWTKWKDSRSPQSGFSGHDTFRFADRSGFLVWRGNAERLTAMVADQRYLERTWLADLSPLLKAQGMGISLRDKEGNFILGVPAAPGAFTIERSAAETGLPWSLGVSAVDPAGELSRSEARRHLFFVALVMVLLVVLAGSYFVGRAATRELAVARLQSDFVAAVSHEFRTPLTSLRHATELLVGGRLANSSELPAVYQNQARATDRLHRLVESLLDFGRIESGAKTYRKERFELTPWVRSVVDDIRKDGLARGCHVDLSIHCDNGTAATVNADADALGCALRNLIDNAVKYSPRSQTVRVDVSRLGDDGDGVAIAVRDEGIGIPAAEQREIFRKFVRGAAAKADGIKGTGIGLAIADEIVRAHGGRIRLESQPGKGSTFTILLPETRS